MKIFQGAIFGMTFEQTQGPIAMETSTSETGGNFAWVAHSGLNDFPDVGSTVRLTWFANFIIPSVALDISSFGTVAYL